MSRKSLILCLSLLAVLIIGTVVAVAFLYKGTGTDGERKTSKIASEERFSLLAAVPSDAVLVAGFSDKGPQNGPMAVSMHYSGKLLPLYVYDAGIPTETGEPSEEAMSIVRTLEEKGLVVRFVSSGREMVLASPSG